MGNGTMMLTGETGNCHRRPPGQHPAEPLDLALAVAVERDRDLVIKFLDGAVQLLLFHADCHLPVVEQSTKIVF